MVILFCGLLFLGCDSQTSQQPNILVLMADDAGHMGSSEWLKTPAFDRIAAAGILFTNAYTPNAKCAPSRASLLTARNSWQLKEACNHFNNFPAEFKTYPETLKDFGYYTGYTGKGWGPGIPGLKDGKPRELCGRLWNDKKLVAPAKHISDTDYAGNFMDFFINKPANQPFYFWCGGYEPHRRYQYKAGIESGKKLSDIKEVPPFFPDNEVVRTDILDYAFEIEYFDSHAGKILSFLEEKGELDNTLVVMTSDHGMPFPRVKSDEYDMSNHIPLAMMWGKNLKNPGRKIENYVSFIDLAPTFFDVAGIPWQKSGMQDTPGSSLRPFFTGGSNNFRDHVLIGKERHDVGRPNDYGYPIRGIVSDGWLYLRNYRPDLWPACNPECGYSTVDGSPTKTEILKSRHNPGTKYLWEWSFGKRTPEELFNLNDDPYCINNLALDESVSGTKKGLKAKMEEELKKQNDPRMFGNGDVFHTYKYTDPRWENLYEKMVIRKTGVVPIWIDSTDIETDFIESN